MFTMQPLNISGTPQFNPPYLHRVVETRSKNIVNLAHL